MAENNNEIDDTAVPFEEALNRTGFGTYSYLMTGLTGVSIISYVCVIYSTTIIVPASACELDTTSAQQGILIAAPIIGALLGSLVWGFLADTRGRKNMLMLSFLLSATCHALVSISVNWIMMMVIQFTASILASSQYSIPMTILSESVPMARRNLVVLLVASIFMLSQGVTAVLAMPVIPLTFSYHLPALGIFWNSWRTLILLYSVPPLICALWLFFMQESPKYVFAKGNEEEALEILRKIHRMNNGKSNQELQVKGLLREISEKPEAKPSKRDQIVPLFTRPLLKYTLIMTTLSIFLQTGSFSMWMPTIMDQFMSIVREGEGLNLTLCGILQLSQESPPPIDTEVAPCSLNVIALLVVFSVGALQSLVNGLLSFVINRVGRRNMVMIITATCGASGLILNWVPNAIASAALFVIFLVGMIVVGLYTAITMALFPTQLRALAVALTMTGGRVVTFGVVQLLNFLLNNNCELGFYIFASMFAASAIVASFLPDDRYLMRPKAPPPEEAKPELPEGGMARIDNTNL